ncbi:hypothetical protein GCM10028825_42500 [Spirosoma agri]
MSEFTAGDIISASGSNGPGTYYGNFHTEFGIKGLSSNAKVRTPVLTNQWVYDKLPVLLITLWTI